MDVTRDIRWAEKNSFYTEHGDWFVLVSAGLLMFGMAILKMGESPAPKVPPAPAA
jgi:apolipoprotein N-acyltransferase